MRTIHTEIQYRASQRYPHSTCSLLHLLLISMLLVFSACDENTEVGGSSDPQPARTSADADNVDTPAQGARIRLVRAGFDGCPPCRKMHETTWKDPAVIEVIKTHATIEDIDVIKDLARSNRLKIRGVPAVIAFGPDGNELSRFSGYHDAKEFMEWFEAALRGIPNAQILEANARKLDTDSPDSQEAWIAKCLLCYEYIRVARYDDAMRLISELWTGYPRVCPNKDDENLFLTYVMDFVLNVPRKLVEADSSYKPSLAALLPERIDGGGGQQEQFQHCFAESAQADEKVIEWHLRKRAEDSQFIRHQNDMMLYPFYSGLARLKQWDMLLANIASDSGLGLVEWTNIKTKLHDGSHKTSYLRTLDVQKWYDDERAIHLASLAYQATYALNRDEQAAAIAVEIIRMMDSRPIPVGGYARLALVKAAIDTGRVGPEHDRWIEEAREKKFYEALKLYGSTPPLLDPDQLAEDVKKLREAKP